MQDYLAARNLSVPVEVETRTLDEVDEVLRLLSAPHPPRIDRLMLDNMAQPERGELAVAKQRCAGCSEACAGGSQHCHAQQDFRGNIHWCGVAYSQLCHAAMGESGLPLTLAAAHHYRHTTPETNVCPLMSTKLSNKGQTLVFGMVTR